MNYSGGVKKACSALALLLIVCALFAMVSCSSGDDASTGKSSDLAGVMAKIDEQFVLGDDMLDLSADDLNAFYGITESEYNQFAAKINTSGVSSDELVFIEAKDGNSAKAIKEKLENRYQSKLNETQNYFPAEYEKIKSGSVMQMGNYVAMIISDNVDSIKDIYENSFE